MKKLTFLGIDTGFGINNNAAYVEDGDKLIIIDCGGTVFSELFKKDQETGFLKNKKEIEVVITHMHDDHTGSLSTLIYYIVFKLGKSIKLVAKCKNLKERLLMTGLREEDFEISEDKDIEFIETVHSAGLDCYGFKMDVDGKKIIYTGDTATLDPFIPYLDGCAELYTDVTYAPSKVHLDLRENLDLLKEISNKGIDVYLMHIDNEQEIKRVIDGTNIRLANEDKLYKEDIVRIVNGYNFDPRKYEIISGAAMVLYGFKEWTRDIDLAVTEDYYVELLRKYKCLFEKVNAQGECIFYIDNILNFGRSFYNEEHTMIDGLPVQTKEDLITLKKALNRPKDKRELELIK